MVHAYMFALSVLIVSQCVVVHRSDEVAVGATKMKDHEKTKWITSGELVGMIAKLRRTQAESQMPYLNALIIDTRSSNEYNGWRSFANVKSDAQAAAGSTSPGGLLSLYDTRNGHMADAHNLDADWVTRFDLATLKTYVSERLVASVNLAHNRQQPQPVGNGSRSSSSSAIKHTPMAIFLYDKTARRLETVSRFLNQHFAAFISSVYACALSDDDMLADVETAADDASTANERAANSLFVQEPFYDMLLSAESLRLLLGIATTSSSSSSSSRTPRPLIDYKLFDVSRGPSHLAYDVSHIPGAVHLDTLAMENGSTYERKSRNQLAELLLDYGLAPNNTQHIVILYGNPEPSAAFRAAILMKWMGVKDVHVLNGGYRAWLTSGFPIESASSPHDSSSSQNRNKSGVSSTSNGERAQLVRAYEEQSLQSQVPINYIVDFNYVSDIVNNYELFSASYALVDVRSFDEYSGKRTTLVQDEQGVSVGVGLKGRIPTSLWGKSGTSAHSLDVAEYRNPDGTMRAGPEILRMWDDLGIEYRTKHLIFYCDNGWRSSEVLFYAELMGLYRISMYDRGWLDWSAKSDYILPLALNPNANASDDAVTSTDATSPTTIKQTLANVHSSTRRETISMATTATETHQRPVPPHTHTHATEPNSFDNYFKTQLDLAAKSSAFATRTSQQLLTNAPVLLLLRAVLYLTL